MSIRSINPAVQRLSLFSPLPAPPHARLVELLRRLAVLSAGVVLVSMVWSPMLATGRLAMVGSLAGLVWLWHRARRGKNWSLVERVIEAALLGVFVSVAGTVTMILPAVYGGLNFRALGRQKGSAATAAGVYLLGFTIALGVRHAHNYQGIISDLSIVLPGVPFCAVLLHALNQALQGREEAETQLRESESHLRHLVEEAPIGIISLANDDIVTMWNPGAERLFGWTADEVIGRPLPVILPERRSAFALSRARDRAGERKTEVDRQFLHKDGTVVDAALSTAPLLNRAREVRGTIALVADVTQRKALEAELRQSQKMEAIGQLAGGIAHDFNNLLTVIIAHAAFLEDAVGESSEQAEDIGEIRRAANGAAGLTRQLLAFSRKQVLRPLVLDLNATVVDLASMLQRLLGEDITIVSRLGGSPVLVRADPGQLEQVVMNLAVNARDAMPFGGSLVISTEIVTDERRTVLSQEGALPPGSYAVLSVRDTGTGMSPETQSRIFEPFFTTKEIGHGTGLGLSTVFGIVAQSNGFLSVESTPGLGTTFCIYMPLQAIELLPVRKGVVKSDKRSRGETILVAEDSDQLRTLTCRILEREGYTVLAAADGVEAIDAAAAFKGQIHLVLTDAVMPRVGGGELVRALHETRTDFRVLYMTGYTEDDLVRRGLGANQGELLHKPFTPEALTERVRLALNTPDSTVAWNGEGADTRQRAS
ncbi:MAG TPA: PAS domain S-box protein [Gemmatimonadaceae bacterium]|nr:PAS domain S-box protein [Gemmatimonadaceae bacterium]